jgi:ribosome-associated protein
MRGRDHETGEFFSPSRSQQRRDALEVLELAEKLASLTPTQLSRLPIPDDLLPHLEHTRKITAHIARKRQLAFLAKQMRREDDETLEAIRDALDEDGKAARRETAAMHRIEDWRERLVAEGDAALAELLEEHPSADRQHLRQLVRNAHEEKLRNKPPRAYRELFQELKRLLAGSGAHANGEAPATTGDEVEDEFDFDGSDDRRD